MTIFVPLVSLAFVAGAVAGYLGGRTKRKAAEDEADRLAHALRFFAIRRHWTVDGGRAGQVRWIGGNRPWQTARRGLDHRWRQGREAPDETA